MRQVPSPSLPFYRNGGSVVWLPLPSSLSVCVCVRVHVHVCLSDGCPRTVLSVLPALTSTLFLRKDPRCVSGRIRVYLTPTPGCSLGALVSRSQTSSSTTPLIAQARKVNHHPLSFLSLATTCHLPTTIYVPSTRKAPLTVLW
jgi:hypothetical protein